MKAKEIKSEDAAETVTVTGWKCKKCSNFWGADERAARFCCATTFPCECGGRRGKSWSFCEDCRNRKDAERWFAKDAVEWDGTFPLAIWSSDEYFWDVDDLVEYLDEWDNQNESMDDDPRITTCKTSKHRHFEMADYLHDNIPEDADFDTDEIDKIVNDWIKGNAPESWHATGERLCIESIRSQL